jgi:PKD repeat protein
MRARFLSTLLGLTLTGLLGRPAQAQQAAVSTATELAPRPCGTDQAMREALGAGYDRWWQSYKEQLQQVALQRPPGSPPAGPRLIVPIVVHIIHTNGPDNIGDEQVYDAIRILNEVFSEMDPDTAQVIPYFKPRIGNTNIEFRLARLDPNGNCTTGITRHFSNLTNSAGENVKDLPGARWTPQRYLNVWVVENIASGAAGYSYLPCGVGPNMEGVVILNDYFGSIGRSPNSQYNRKSFPHEVGHYLGLPHTWGRTNTPGLPTNCSDDDGIADTPNTEGHSFNCDLSAPACPGDPYLYSNVQNIMDYAGCPAMFTQGQSLVMNGGIVSNFACRTGLSTLQNLTLAGVADGQNVGPCAPIAFLTAVGGNNDETVQRLCAGDSARFHAEAYNIVPGTAVQFRWRFPGGVPATSTLQDPTVTYPTPGLYNVVLYASNTVGTDSLVQTGYVKVQNTATGLTTPSVETFDDPTFPLNAADPLKNWEVTRPSGSTTWEYTNLAAAQGTGSVRLRLRNTAADTEYDLISPNIVFATTMQRPYLYFKRAYSQRTSTNADRLTISYSTNCGVTWITRGASSIRSAAQLTTANPSGSLYVPTPSQWKQDSIVLSTGTLPAGTHIMVRFRMLSDLGNVIYLDDLRIGSRITGLGEDPTVSTSALTIYPNPSNGEALVRLSTGRVAGKATVRVLDAAGRLLGQPWHVNGTPTDGGHEVSLRTVAGRPLAAGVYVVELTTADGARQTQRALVF